MEGWGGGGGRTGFRQSNALFLFAISEQSLKTSKRERCTVPPLLCFRKILKFIKLFLLESTSYITGRPRLLSACKNDGFKFH